MMMPRSWPGYETVKKLSEEPGSQADRHKVLILAVLAADILSK